MAFGTPPRQWKRGVEGGIQLGGKVWGQGGVALDKRGLVVVELAGSLSRDQLKEEEDKGTGRLGLGKLRGH